MTLYKIRPRLHIMAKRPTRFNRNFVDEDRKGNPESDNVKYSHVVEIMIGSNKSVAATT